MEELTEALSRICERNRKNARKSTGPRSARGKARAAANATAHGLLSRSTLLPGEDAGELAALESRLREHLQPVGPVEELLVDQVTSSTWRLARLNRVEAGLFQQELCRIEIERADRHLERARDKFTTDQIEETTTELKAIEQMEEEQPLAHQALLRATVAEMGALEELPTLGLAFQRDVQGPDAFAKLARYTAPIEKGLYRALHELQRLQAERRGVFVPPPAAGDLNVHLDG